MYDAGICLGLGSVFATERKAGGWVGVRELLTEMVLHTNAYCVSIFGCLGFKGRVLWESAVACVATKLIPVNTAAKVKLSLQK